MQGQQRKSQSVVSPVRIETFYNENKDRFYREDEIHLRLIQLNRGRRRNRRPVVRTIERDFDPSQGRGKIRGACQGIQQGYQALEGRRPRLVEAL
jgi:hypothetical protein